MKDNKNAASDDHSHTDEHSDDGGHSHDAPSEDDHHHDEHEDPQINNVTIKGIEHDILGASDDGRETAVSRAD